MLTTRHFFLIVYIVGVLLLFAIIYSPDRHPQKYDYIVLENVYDELVLNNVRNLHLSSGRNTQNCSYRDRILNNYGIDTESISSVKLFEKPKSGGEYVPNSCKPLIKTALITPYRNRAKQLEIFLNYMHNFLQKQYIHYRIFVVEQNDTLPFNRAKMFNYGAHLAIKMNYDCLILHDVDLLPLSSGNIYGCSKKPRHMSSNIDIFRYILPYPSINGGVGSILSEQYRIVNGMSNIFFGWGGEDDDFYNRLKKKNLVPYRFAPELSKYSMLYHRNEKPSADRYKLLRDNTRDPDSDGLSSLGHNYSIKLEELYTHILAKST